ncbi:MAG: FadR/GntR family transcriptional regulator [Candidatus Promineifilaceae bacterium]
MHLEKLDSQFLQYLIDKKIDPGERLPTLQEISQEMGISVGKLREQLEVARTLGIVSVKPRVGIIREPFNFQPVVLNATLFGLGTEEITFEQVSQMRRALEQSLWYDAVTQLTDDDKQHLRKIVDQAWQKLRGTPIHVPNGEHRELHLTIFSRLQNPIVQGLLDTYWNAYEASELTRYLAIEYWYEVWDYHGRIVDALIQNDFDLGRKLLLQHFELLPKTHVQAAVIGVENP